MGLFGWEIGSSSASVGWIGSPLGGGTERSLHNPEIVGSMPLTRFGR